MTWSIVSSARKGPLFAKEGKKDIAGSPQDWMFEFGRQIFKLLRLLKAHMCKSSL